MGMKTPRTLNDELSIRLFLRYHQKLRKEGVKFYDYTNEVGLPPYAFYNPKKRDNRYFRRLFMDNWGYLESKASPEALAVIKGYYRIRETLPSRYGQRKELRRISRKTPRITPRVGRLK